MNRYSVKINVIKALAVFSVICAHCGFVEDTAPAFARISSLLLSHLGTAGVLCFFVLSGMLFHYQASGGKQFFYKKAQYLLIPWIISGSCIYFYTALRKGGLSLKKMGLFLLGDGSYLYYLTILMLFYGIFWMTDWMRSKTALYLCQIVTLLSVLFFWWPSRMSPYLNPLIWIGYFASGMLIARQDDKLYHIWRWMKKHVHWIWLTCIALTGIQLVRSIPGSYWGGVSALLTMLMAVGLALLAAAMPENSQLSVGLQGIGANSFFIYLWHMPIAGITANIMNRGVLVNFVLLRPLLVFGVVVGALALARWILHKLHAENLLWVVGIRN